MPEAAGNPPPKVPPKEPRPAPSGSSAAPPSKPAGPQGGPGKQQGGFQVIRNAPVRREPDGSSAATLGGVAILLGVLAIGAWMFTRGDTSTPANGAAGQTEQPPPPPPTPLPDFMLGTIEFLENEGKLKDALDKAESYQKDYPNSPELIGKIKSLRQKLGLESGGAASPQSAAPLVAEAQRGLRENKLDQALEAIDRATEIDPENADAFFLRGQILAAQGDKLGAIGSYEEARRLGFDSDQVDAAIKQAR